MPVASVFFALSFIGLASMVAARLRSLHTGRPGLFSFLAHYDGALGDFLVRAAIFARVFSALLRQRTAAFFRQSHHFIAELIHFLVKEVEQRVHEWRDFARERKIERGSASAFIQDVVEYKKELKQNGHQHTPPSA